MDKENLATDLLSGVPEIAKFMGLPKRRVYFLAENGLLPLFKFEGSKVWQGRRSTLFRHMDELEAKQAEAV